MEEKLPKFDSLTFRGRLRHFLNNLFLPYRKLPAVYKKTKLLGRIGLVLGCLIMGAGQIIKGQMEKGILFLAINILYIYYLFVAGWQSLSGAYSLDYLDLRLVFIIFTLLIGYIYWLNIKDLVSEQEKINDGKLVVKSFILSFFKEVHQTRAEMKSDFWLSYQLVNIRIKISLLLSFIFMGIPQMLQKQIIKGMVLLGIQIAYVSYMFFSGYECLKGLITLKVMTQKSDASLLYGIVAVVISLLYLYFHYQSIKIASENAKQISLELPIKSFREEIKESTGKKFYRLALLFPIIGVIVFTILPLIFMICIAFTNYGTSGVIPNIRDDKYLSWIGFATFGDLFTFGSQFKTLVNVFGWTILWAVLATLTCYFGGLLFALLINKKVIKHKKLYRSLFVIAMAVPQFVTLRIMNSMFDKFGPINNLFGTSIEFWADTGMARTLIIMINMWIGIPFFMLLISGLLVNIPQDYYDAAKVEGASKWVIFRRIIFPQILFMTTPLLITNFVSNINNFNVIWLLTRGGPVGVGYDNAGGTDILITWLYKLTMLDRPEYNLGAAIGIIMFILSASLSLFIFRNSVAYKKEEEFQG